MERCLQMPIKVPDGLPAIKALEHEHIFIMQENRATHQDIRPLKIVILNLMPRKSETETQLLRLLGNTPLQVEADLLQTVTHTSKNTPAEYLLHFYKCFEDIKSRKYDGMIITGAPVEQIPFESVDYWPELCEIMEWSLHNVYSTLHICWGAQAGLYYHYGIQKYNLPKKMFGVFKHRNLEPDHPLMRGFDDTFYAPHSRHTGNRLEDILNEPGLDLLSASEKAGPYIVAAKSGRQFFITGHSEYDRQTLSVEYFRDLSKGLAIDIPYSYFPDDRTDEKPAMKWRSHASLLFANWLNYFVYQQTPYNLNEIL